MKCLLLLFILIFSSGVCVAKEVQVIFATGEWPPFSSEDLPEYGTATALVSAICKAGGIQPKYEFYPWKRAELKVVSGEIFAAFPYAISEERKKIYDFSDTLFYGVFDEFIEHLPDTTGVAMEGDRFRRFMKDKLCLWKGLTPAMDKPHVDCRVQQKILFEVVTESFLQIGGITHCCEQCFQPGNVFQGPV
jgi:hypothetical protein